MTEYKRRLSVVCFILGVVAIMPQKAYAWVNNDDDEENQVYRDGRGTVYEKRGNVVYSNRGDRYTISGSNVYDSRGNRYTVYGRNVMDENGDIKCTVYDNGLVDCRD